MRPYLLADTTWKTVDPTPYEVAVLPWGATEAHNYHLPYTTDVIQCDYVAAEAARRAWDQGARIIVLPTVPFGVQTTQLDIKLCINLDPSTQLAILSNVAASLDQQGIRKLVVLNGHGANDFRQMIRELQPRTRVFMSAVNWYKIVDQTKYFTDLGDHSGEMETSVMMHIAPDRVLPLSEAGSGKARPWRIPALREGWAWSPRRWREVTADTGIGDPSRATAEKGKVYLEESVAKLAGYFVDLAKADLTRLYE